MSSRTQLVPHARAAKAGKLRRKPGVGHLRDPTKSHWHRRCSPRATSRDATPDNCSCEATSHAQGASFHANSYLRHRFRTRSPRPGQWVRFAYPRRASPASGEALSACRTGIVTEHALVVKEKVGEVQAHRLGGPATSASPRSMPIAPSPCSTRCGTVIEESTSSTTTTSSGSAATSRRPTRSWSRGRPASR